MYIFSSLFLISSYFRRVFRARARPLEHYSEENSRGIAHYGSIRFLIFTFRPLDDRRLRTTRRVIPLETRRRSFDHYSKQQRIESCRKRFRNAEIRLDQRFSVPRVFEMADSLSGQNFVNNLN